MPRQSALIDPLVCPGCGSRFGASERFCPGCKLPQLSGGELVRVAGGRNQAEAEFIQGMLLEEGVPSMLRRSAGFDVPDFLAAGPRDILVPLPAVGTAREVLLEAELISPEPSGPIVSPARLLVGLLVALALGALVVWVATLVVH